MKTFSEGELRALISLLDEEDAGALRQITFQLKSALRFQAEQVEAVLGGLDVATSGRVAALVEDVRWDALEDAFTRFADRSKTDVSLEDGLYLIATFAYPKLKREDVSGPLDAMGADLARLFSGRERALDVIHLLNDYLFVLKGFKGNGPNYNDPDNSFINRVLERKLGIPITLSALYLLAAKRVALPVAGIGLPGHFIVQFQAPNQRLYLDPFRGGKILTVADCQELLMSQGLSYDRRYFRPVSNRSLIARVLANLIHVYTDRGDQRKTDRLSRLFKLLQEED